MTEPDHPQPTRSEQIAAGLDAVRHRIARACSDAGRDPGEVTLIVVTKTYPVSDVVRLAALGVLDVGENREQEASAKVSAVLVLPSATLPKASTSAISELAKLAANELAVVVELEVVLLNVERLAQ